MSLLINRARLPSPVGSARMKFRSHFDLKAKCDVALHQNVPPPFPVVAGVCCPGQMSSWRTLCHDTALSFSRTRPHLPGLSTVRPYHRSNEGHVYAFGQLYFVVVDESVRDFLSALENPMPRTMPYFKLIQFRSNERRALYATYAALWLQIG